MKCRSVIRSFVLISNNRRSNWAIRNDRISGGARHHTLLDARWTKDAWAFLARFNPVAGERRAIGCKNRDRSGALRA
jgi:hypothetical protein